MSKKEKQTNKENEKTAYNNQWTNNQTVYKPEDQRERRDGPGGN